MCRITMGHLRVIIGHLRVTIGHLKVTKGHLRVSIGHLRVTISYFRSLIFFLWANIKQTQLSFTPKYACLYLLLIEIYLDLYSLVPGYEDMRQRGKLHKSYLDPTFWLPLLMKSGSFSRSKLYSIFD